MPRRPTSDNERRVTAGDAPELATRANRSPTIDPSYSQLVLPAVGGGIAEAVTTALRESILDGALRPGQWLRENELAAALRVSRTPVREALRRLSDDGLAVRTPQQGVAVAALTLDDVLALYVVREPLEGLAARLAAKRTDNSLLKDLEASQAELKRAGKRGDTRGCEKANLHFHRLLRQAANNAYLEKFLLQVEHAVRRLPRSTFAVPGRYEEVLEEHGQIISAIRAGDIASAEQAAQTHMRKARNLRIAILIEG